MALCRNCGVENPDGFRFCGACGTSLDIEPPARREERKVVTVLFTDIVGSTARAETMDPEDVRAMLAPYYERLRRELEAHGGTVEKFIGDAVVAVFGAPIAHEDDPDRAVHAALAIQTAIVEMNAADEWLNLHVRIGINTGEALVVLDARPIEGEGMIAGDVINTAARLQSNAPVDGIIVGKLTYAATRHAIEYRSLEPIAAKGKAEPLPVWEVLGVKETPTPDTSVARPLIGRKSELSRLQTAWTRVNTNRTPVVVTIVGAPGVGKSRLLTEFTHMLGTEALVYRGRCLSYGEGITYWPLIDVIKRAAGVLQTDDPDVMSSKLQVLVDGLRIEDEDDLRTVASALSNLLEIKSGESEQITQAELHWGIRRFFQLLSNRSPVAVVIEDLHWAEPTLLELIRYLGQPLPGGRLLILATARPELIDDKEAHWGAERSHHETIELATLDIDDSRSLLAELHAVELNDAAIEALLLAAGGNPLFLEETVEMLTAEGVPGGDRSAFVQERIAIGVPTNLQSLIGARLDQLASEEKAVAQRAAVAGSVFWEGAIAHLDGIGKDLGECLRVLERRDFVHVREMSTVAGEREFAFKHNLIRDVAYSQVPKGRRTELHARFAEWVSVLPGTHEEFVEIVAHHLEQACRLAREVARAPIPPPIVPAVQALTAAAEKAERREGLREADRFYERALEVLGEQHPEIAIDLNLRRAKILAARGELGRATQHLVTIAEQATLAERRDLRCDALIALANVDQKQGRAADARRRLLEAEELATQIEDRCLQIRSGYESAALRADFDGQDDEAIADLRRSLALATEIDDRALRVEGHLRVGVMLANSGELEAAQKELSACSTLAAAIGSHRDEARATYVLGAVRYYLGDLPSAEELLLRARGWLEQTGDNYFQVQNLLALAGVDLKQRAPERAERWLREALPLALEGGGWLAVEVYRFMVEALIAQGRLDDAAELARFARQSVPEEDLNALAAAAVADAIVATATGDQSTALSRFSEAVGLLAAQDSPIQLGETRVAHARALRKFGHKDEADAELHRARESFERMQARGFLAEIDALQRGDVT